MTPIKGYEGRYAVTVCGKVWSEPRDINFGQVIRRVGGIFLKPKLDKDGYHVVNLRIDGKDRVKRIARLVAEAYVPNPGNLALVGYIDGDKTNLEASNLKWISRAEERALYLAQRYH